MRSVRISRSRYAEMVRTRCREDEELERLLGMRLKRKEKKSSLAAWLLKQSKKTYEV